MMAMGYETDADLGGAWGYIQKYATDAKIEPIKACMDVLKRTCEAVSTILDRAWDLDNSDKILALGCEVTTSDKQIA